MKRIIAILMVLLMSLALCILPACNKDGGDDNTTVTTVDGDGEIEATFADRSYDGYEYKVLCTTQCEEFYVTPDATSTVIQENVVNRNITVQGKYGVTLSFNAMNGTSSGREAFAAEIRRASSAGDECYDLVIGQTYYTMALALEGMYYNMADSPYLNLDQPWYDGKLINDNINIAGKLFAASGSFVISQTSTIMGLYYNKTMFDENQCAELLDGKDIYTAVKDGEWTFEKLEQMTRLVYIDTNYNDKTDADDIYGFVGNIHAPMSALIASETPITTKDDLGDVYIDYYNEHLISVFETYFDFFNAEKSVTFVAADEALIDFFANSQSMFCCNAIEFLAKGSLGASGIDYGILPFPKYDEIQETYFTNTLRWEVAHIPSVCDTERAAIIFEYLNYSSYNTLIPAYFETVLQYQKAQSSEDAEMLQLLRDTVYFDFMVFYQTQVGVSSGNNIFTAVRNLINNKDKGIASWWDSNKGMYEEKFTELIDTYKYFLE